MKQISRSAALFLVSFFLLTGCHQKEEKHQTHNPTPPTDVNTQKNSIQRFGMITGLKPEKVAYYKQLHSAVWPAVQKKIKDCNIQNYSIYLKEIDNKYYLFSYFEYAGNNFQIDMKKMAEDSTTQRWWRETAPTQIPLPDAAAKKETWSSMEEVFHEE